MNGTKKNLTDRQSNFELLRIVAMFMIVFYHCTLHQLDEAWEILQVVPFSINYIWTVLIGSWGAVANMIFVIISSWFLVDKEGMHVNKLIMLAFQAWLVSVVITIVVMVFRLETVSFSIIIKEILTPIYHQYGFLLSYLIFYMLVPFGQHFVQHISYAALKRLCIILTLVMPVYALIFNETAGGFAVFIYLFLMTAYQKKTEDNFLEKYRWWFFVFSFGSLVGLLIVIKVIKGIAYTELFNNNILIVIMAFSVFYIFKNLNIGHSKVINYVSDKCLGIYLLHENMLCFAIWDGIFHMSDRWDSNTYIFYYISSVFLVYLVCFVLECVRSKIVDGMFFGRWKRFWEICSKIDADIKRTVFVRE